MKLSIIIVSYNTSQVLQDCLNSVYQFKPQDRFEVIVVDNASADQSIKMIKQHFHKVKLIKNSQNLGFAKANNQAIKKAKGEYILLLNSDTRVKKNALTNLIAFMDKKPQAAIASAQLLNPDGSIQQSGGFIPRLSNIAAWMLFLDDLPGFKNLLCSYHKTPTNFYKKTRRLDWVQGAAMLLRRLMLNQVGLLDEKLFMYGEDIDLCLRSKKAGWETWSVKNAPVVHLGFQSSQGVNQNAILGEYKALKYIFKKHKPTWELPLLILMLKLGALMRMLIFGTILRDQEKYATYQKAFNLA